LHFSSLPLPSIFFSHVFGVALILTGCASLNKLFSLCWASAQQSAKWEQCHPPGRELNDIAIISSTWCHHLAQSPQSPLPNRTVSNERALFSVVATGHHNHGTHYSLDLESPLRGLLVEGWVSSWWQDWKAVETLGGGA
jgi:hypothetical protein